MYMYLLITHTHTHTHTHTYTHTHTHTHTHTCTHTHTHTHTYTHAHTHTNKFSNHFSQKFCTLKQEFLTTAAGRLETSARLAQELCTASEKYFIIKRMFWEVITVERHG